MTTREEWAAKTPRMQFWQNEPTLVPIVKKVFDEQTLSEDELGLLKAYLQSWITWVSLIPEDADYVAIMEEIQMASQRHIMSKTVFRLLDYAIDPF